MIRLRPAIVLVAALGFLGACSESTPAPESSFRRRHLEPVDNQFSELRASRAAPQPNREKPRAVVYDPKRRRLYVALQGAIDHPGDAVVVVDVDRRKVVRRYDVGRSPTGLALHPEGRHLVVSNRYSNFLSVIDLERRRVRSHPADFYVRQLAFSPDGGRLYATNRWRDTLQIWRIERSSDQLTFERVRPDGKSHGISVGTNPESLAVAGDGSRIWVAAPGAATISAVDANSLEPVELRAGPSAGRLRVGAPPNDIVLHRGSMYVPTLADSSGHPARRGPDTDRDGRPGDGTPNTTFNDVQNELAVYDRSTGRLRVRYTSDTICCRDVDDVSPEDPRLGGLLPERERWIVGGAFPETVETVVVDGKAYLLVLYAGSNELQRFRIRRDGRLRAGRKLSMDFNPMGLAVSEDRREAYVTNRLSETLTIVDLRGFEVVDSIVVGDTSGGAFPATDAELGEFLFFSGARFSVDGDITCNHCHPQRGARPKTFRMPLLADPRGVRNTPDARGLFRSQPWFFEGAMDAGTFDREINRAARSANFCCSDHPDLDNCEREPPDVCRERPYPSRFPTRDVFFLREAVRLFGRAKTFGDSQPKKPLDSDGIADMLALFLMQEPGLLPSPFSAETRRAKRGRRIFNSAGAGCAGCHRRPGFMRAQVFHPAPWVFGPVITPNRSSGGANLDRVRESFVRRTTVRQDRNVRLKATSLLGIWNRPPPFLHDGRAANLREAVSSPGHPVLAPDETGFNEKDGLPDTHGGTSHLSADQIEALIAYMKTL